jgi:uncharacterized protein (TIGR02246 family)
MSLSILRVLRRCGMARMVAVLVCLGLLAAGGCQPKVDTIVETAPIKAVLDNYIASIEREDMTLYGRVMAHDSDMVNFGTSEAPIIGWEALRKLIEEQNAALSETKIIARDVSVQISPSGKFAWATSLWDFKAVAGGAPIEIPVRCTWVLEKRDNGWVIVHFHKSVRGQQ